MCMACYVMLDFCCVDVLLSSPSSPASLVPENPLNNPRLHPNVTELIKYPTNNFGAKTPELLVVAPVQMREPVGQRRHTR